MSPLDRPNERNVVKLSFDAEAIDVISVDLFDTVLLRDHRCERRRFLLMARKAAAELQRAGCAVSAEALYRSRLDAQRLAYRALELARPEGDVPLRRIYHMQTTILGLPAGAAGLLKAAELDFEAASLRPNRGLLGRLAALRAGGKRVIAISDIYLPRHDLCGLLDQVAPGHPIAAVYCSAELNLTKRSSALFRAVLDLEGVQAARVLHLGDDRRADHEMARRAGLQARWLPRRRMKLLRKLDGALLLSAAAMTAASAA
jgi:FMN phosphatase YigB (HAD superfamily)